MDTFKKKTEKITNTLRRPVTIVKKRSGPLDDMLDQLDRNDETPVSSPLQSSNLKSFVKTFSPDEEQTKSETLDTFSPSASMRRRHIKDKDKKRERWLLTRKTWRYMTDAGRKLLPDGTQHGNVDNFKNIEAHFQQVCAMEPRFILWRRKGSYPGATKHSRKRLKILLRHRSKLSHIKDQEQHKIIENTIELLQSYLKIRDSYKTTALLGTKTIRPDQTASPSSRRPINQSVDQYSNSKDDPSDSKNILFNLLQELNRNSVYMGLDIETIAPAIMEDKTQLKKIYNILKKQQLHRLLDSRDLSKANLGRACSMSSLVRNTNLHETIRNVNRAPNLNMDVAVNASTMRLNQDTIELCSDRRRKPLGTLDINLITGTTQINHRPSTNSCGTQTNFIQLSELKLLAEQYEQFFEQTNEGDAKEEKQSECGRKSSIDNEDISQSVSDTIKRYLRMARKKNVLDADANRFKSVNYDRNLRNIRAKGEINPPGMDQDNSKAVQTLDAWAVISLDFIRGIEDSPNLQNAHIAWQKDLDERIRKKLEYDQNCRAVSSSKSIKAQQNACKSAPTSPTSPTSAAQQHHHLREKTGRTATALLSSSSQFLSNFWHTNSSEPLSTHNIKNGNSNDIYLNSKNERTNMQKSKSLSNVGQFVSRKIWGNRSKYQNRQDGSRNVATYTQKWSPSENFAWKSDQGQYIQLTETSLEKLSDIEAESLIKIALDKIRELNIGTNIDLESKVCKKRILLRKRALTTSFFDIGKKDEHSRDDFLFGTSLENCILREKKRLGSTVGSKHSLMSLFLSNDNSSEDGKLHNNVRSCESLPTKPLDTENSTMTDYYFKNIGQSQLISQSQIDMRSDSEMDLDQIVLKELTPAYNRTLNVPMFVINCIEYLEQHGLQKIGLFRVSTSKRRVKQLREDLDKNVNKCIPVDTCPHDVATLLKEYFRDLPEPLLCKGLYTTFLETQRIRNRRLQLEAISHLVKLLPTAHRDTLYVLLKFLGNVAAHCDDVYSRDGTIQMIGNKMDSNNISTVFAPNILRESSPKTEYKESNLSDAINIIRIMIDHYEEIFKVPCEIIDLLYTHMLDACPEKLNALISEKTCLFYNSGIEKTHPKSDGEILEPPFDGRRQSTPVVLENPQVISASLQITVPEESPLQIDSKISEPKLPASISNIGGETLCAKTADFERSSHRNEPTAFIPMPTTRTKTLYKRQQLISSSRQ